MSSPDTPVPHETAGPAIRVRVQRSDAAVVLAVSGEVDLLTAGDMRQAVLAALAEHPALLVLDLLAVDFLASAGLAILFEAQQLAVERTRLRVVADGPATLRPLQVTGLAEPLDIYTTRDEALNG